MVFIELWCGKCFTRQFVEQDITEIWYCHYCGTKNVNKMRVRKNAKNIKPNSKRVRTVTSVGSL